MFLTVLEKVVVFFSVKVWEPSFCW